MLNRAKKYLKYYIFYVNCGISLQNESFLLWISIEFMVSCMTEVLFNLYSLIYCTLGMPFNITIQIKLQDIFC